MTTNGSSPNPAFDALVSELVKFGGVMAQIIDHMARFSASGLSDPEAPPSDIVLQGLLGDVIAPKVRGRSSADVRATTAMLAEISAAITEEIYLVPPETIESWRAEEE